MLARWVERWGRCQWVGRVVWGVGRVRIRTETYVEFEELSEEELFS